ncbi:unnamed protein product [Heterobilharzia americana]|nr:unnamed protein product [Heterobilharzia americana]
MWNIEAALLKCVIFQRYISLFHVNFFKSKQMVVCTVCTTETSKYKCPVCVSPYCSVACYQVHKQNSCERKVSTTIVEHAAVEQEDDMIDYVPKRVLQGLKHSERIRVMLKNPHLRSLLRYLNDTNKPNSALENAMREPIFVEFSDECLKIVESG